MKRKIRISIVVGTRPNLVKLSPLIRKIVEDGGFDFQLIDTGQHYDYELDGKFIDELGIPKPIFLGIGSGSHAEQTGNALIKIEKELKSFKPGMVIVIGDTNSTLAGALAASKLRIPLGHIEAGLRHFDFNFPEEINRVVVDRISDMLFAPTKTAVKNLKADGIPKEKIFFTYDINVDAIRDNYEISKKSGIAQKLGITKGFLLVTLHRPFNVDDKGALNQIIDALVELGNELEIVFPAHPRTLKNLRKFGLLKKCSANIKLTKPLGYIDFLKLLGSASCVLTDSGGIQKEALILKTPCISIMPNTGWVETVRSGANVLIEPKKAAIIREVKKRCSQKFRNSMKKVKNPYGDGKTSARIIKILKEWKATKQ